MIIGYAIPAVQKFQGAAYKSLYYQALEISKADGATPDDNPCLIARGDELYRAGVGAVPSVLIIPQFVKPGAVYTQIPTPTLEGGDFDQFTVTRATTATRVNASGLIESVASGVLRLDYPIGGGCPALLVEASGTNGILNSNNTTTSWTLGANLSSGAIDVIGVSGNNINVAVSGGGLGTNSGVIRRLSNNVALASGSTYTISFFLKKTGTHTIGGYYATITGAASGDLAAGFNVSGSFSSGSIYNTAGTTNRIRRVEQWGTDVYRCSETFTMTASGTLTTLALAPVGSVSTQSNPDVGLGIGFAAPQIELGAAPTSFIPTTTAAVTRNADNISASGALVSGLIGQAEGTLYAEVVFSRINANTVISLGSTNDRIQISFDSSTGIYALIRVGGLNVDYNATIPAIPSTGGVYKIALGYKANDYCFAVNGVAYNPSTASRGVPSNMSAVYLGASVFSTGQLNDRIRAAALYTTRLSNDQLESITRLT